MNMKINTICFIILLFLLIGVASAADNDNETLKQTIKQPDDNICQASLDNTKDLQASNKCGELKTSNGKKVLNSLTGGKSSKIKTSIKAPNVKMYYKDGSDFTMTLKDSSKKAIKKAKVKITIADKTYTKTTNSNGKISLDLNLNCGSYNVVTSYDGSKKYYGSVVKSTITVKSTIKSSGMTKYYTNKATHDVTFYDKKGTGLKNTAVKFKLNGKTYSVKTNKKGVAKLAIDLKPGTYVVSQTNPKTHETTSNIIQIKTILETEDLTMTEQDGSKFSVKILNDNGKVAANKKVSLKVNQKTYIITSNSKGIATLPINLSHGVYSITTEYGGLTHTNQITVNKGLKKTEFSHITLIPDYVNVTVPYVFSNSQYAVKTGQDGIIKLPKNDVFAIHINQTKYYLFSKMPLYNTESIILDHNTYFIPFDGSCVKSDYNEDNLKGEGILISKIKDYTKIEFRSTTEIYADLFGVTLDKRFDNVEEITYTQNDRVMTRIMFFTGDYDEVGLKSNLAKLYGKDTFHINFGSYDEITSYNSDKIKYSNTGEVVKYGDFRRYIEPSISNEYIKTKFIVDGIEELEKDEIISYGQSEKYQVMRGFEVMQSYAILNDKISPDTLKEWLRVNSAYLSKIGIISVYGMFLASLETAWIADEIADEYAKDLNVTWDREKTTTILGGINLEDTYLHILNADMGMTIYGNNDNANIFRLINSLNLPNIEEYALKPVADRYSDNTTNSLVNVLSSAADNFSIAQLGELLYIFDNNNSAIILNTTSGLSNVISKYGNNVYKGSKVSTKNDCCSVCLIATAVINGISDLIKKTSQGLNLLSDLFNNIHPITTMAYNIAKFLLSSKLSGIPSLANGLLSVMVFIQATGSTYRDKMVDENDWHSVMDKITFTRPGYLQSKKIYNIPNENGGTDYVEVKINDDLSLNRTNVKYISPGKTKVLTEKETYQYFHEDYWTPFSMPTKYWDKSWKSK